MPSERQLRWVHLDLPGGVAEQRIFDPPSDLLIIKSLYPKAKVRAMTEEEISAHKRRRKELYLMALRTTEC